MIRQSSVKTAGCKVAGAGGTKATVRETSTTDGINALRVGMDPVYGNEAAIYKTFSGTAVDSGVVDLWIDMRHHGSSGQFFIGDASMALGEVYNPETMTSDLSTRRNGSKIRFCQWQFDRGVR